MVVASLGGGGCLDSCHWPVAGLVDNLWDCHQLITAEARAL